ncbi:hypothetical protein CspeluHIS016_0300010, partial [Cutaneotrichosporon spelunceum]
YRVLSLNGVVHATLELPASELELVNAVVTLSQDTQSPDVSFGSDDSPSLTWSNSPPYSDASDSSDSASIQIELTEFLGGGHTWDAFEATLGAGVPGGLLSRIPAVVKHVDLASLQTPEQALLGYPELGRVLDAVDREKRLLRCLTERAPGIAPRPYAVWTVNDHILLATEDCGNTVTTPLGDDTKREIISAYHRVHAAGVVHGDVQLRHVVRDRHGTLRIVDWEGAYEVDTQSPAGRAVIEREMHEVYHMMGI